MKQMFKVVVFGNGIFNLNPESSISAILGTKI